jgi:starch synthase
VKILFVVPECVPFAKAGGLGDVAGALPKALLRRGHDVRVLLPLYGTIDRGTMWKHGAPLGVPLGPGVEAWCAVHESRLPGSDVPIYFLEHQALYGAAYVYGGYDEHEFARFALLSRAAFQLSRYLGFAPDILHLHDWPSAPVAALSSFVETVPPFTDVATVFTMHNVAHQPRFPVPGLGLLSLGPEVLSSDGFEDYGELNPFKAGVVYSDILTTVSPTYAWEIATPEGGAGLHDLMNRRRSDLMGILNGIDTDVWNPATDPFLPAHYDGRDMFGKTRCKNALRAELGLVGDDDRPLLGVVARLTVQKGIDLLVDAFDAIMATGSELVVLGTGDPVLHAALQVAGARHPDTSRVVIGYDEGLAHRIEAGCDLFLMPSRFEPCGLNQLYSQRYGTPPVVRRVGGLADSVEAYGSAAYGLGTGFMFDDLSVPSFMTALDRALRLYREEPSVFRAMQQAGMRKDFSWARAASGYEEAYDRAKVRRRARQDAA